VSKTAAVITEAGFQLIRQGFLFFGGIRPNGGVAPLNWMIPSWRIPSRWMHLFLAIDVRPAVPASLALDA
jgi:hypothetical protein